MSEDMLKVAHETVKSLHEAGVVDKLTMHRFDTLCWPAAQAFEAQDIKLLRDREHVSQPVLAHALNVSPSTVKQWEIGDKRPSGTALKLLDLIRRKGLAVVL